MAPLVKQTIHPPSHPETRESLETPSWGERHFHFPRHAYCISPTRGDRVEATTLPISSGINFVENRKRREVLGCGKDILGGA